MKQNKVYPYVKKDGVVSIVGGSIIFATSSTSSTFHQTLETAPKAVSTSERLMSLLIIGLSCPKRFDVFE